MSRARGAAAGNVPSGSLDRWLFAPVPAHAMVLARFVLGGVLSAHALSRLPELGRVYGNAGLAWTPVYRELVGSLLAGDLGRLPLLAVSLLSELGEDARGPVLTLLYALFLASSLAFAAGLRARVAGLVSVALHLFFLAVDPLAHYGWAGMLAPYAGYVALSRAGDFAGVDAWLRRRRGEPAPPALIPAWPMRLLQIHVAAMYFHTGFARIDDPDWLRGEVLFEALARELFTRVSLDLHAWRPALLVLSFGVFVLEPAAALLLWIPRLRTACATALLAMHVVLEILTNVGWWNLIMIAGLVTFLPPAWIARATPGPGPVRTAPELEPGGRGE